MQVDHDKFVEWAENHFGDLTVSGYEVKVNDPWWTNSEGLADQDQKCWINTIKGCFHAWKSERHGNIVEFVMITEGCDWETALETIGGGLTDLSKLDDKMAEFIGGEEEALPETPKPQVTLPPDTYLIESVLKSDQRRKWALNYLKDRFIDPSGLMVCLNGKYRDRIVIPYYDANGGLIYFNTRALSSKDKLRYWGPSKEEFGVGKGDVLWMAPWPEPGSKIYLTEGEFDAMSLTQCGLFGAACGGKALSDKQIEMLRPYRIALAFDSDKAGADVYEISQNLLKKSHLLMDSEPRITIVRPPEEYKDWNKFLTKHAINIIRMYIDFYESPCNEDTLQEMRFHN